MFRGDERVSEPGRFGAGESTFWLALVVGLAVAGLVLLVLQR